MCSGTNSKPRGLKDLRMLREPVVNLLSKVPTCVLEPVVSLWFKGPTCVLEPTVNLRFKVPAYVEGASSQSPV